MATVPRFVLDNHQRYKEENSAVIKFMVEEASGYDTNQDVPLSRLARLAHYLVNDRGPPLEIPTRIVRSLRTTISLRQRCSSWYQQRYNTNPSEALLWANQRHQYAINVLAEVLSIFEPHAVATDPVDVGKQPEGAQKQQDMSIFEQLEVYSPEHESLGLTREGAPSKPEESVSSSTGRTSSLSGMSKAQKRSLGKAVARHVDPYFAVALLLLSLEPIRNVVCEKWGSFQVDPSQLIVASMAMNAAIGFAHQMEAEFLADFKDYKDWEDVMGKLFSPTAEVKQNSMATHDELIKGAMGEDFGLPFEYLSRFRTYLDEGRIGETSGGDEAFLYEHFLDITSLVGLDEQLPAPDELILGLRGVLRGSRKISLGIVFGLVVFLDKRHNLGGGVARGFDRLAATADVFETTKKSQVVCEGVISGQKLSENDRRKLSQNVNFMNSWIKSDRFSQLRRSQGLESDPLGSRTSFAFYKRNALASGLIQLAMLLDMRRVGMDHIDAYGYVKPMAHLYNAMRCEEVVAAPWHDMEDFMALHGGDYLIQRHEPEELSAHLSRLCLAEGVPLDAFAKDKRPTRESKVKEAKEKTRKIKSSKFIAALDDMLCPGEDKSAVITLGQVETLLLERAEKKSNQGAKEDSLYAQWNKTHKLGPMQLLSILEECLVEESPKLFFNYYALHKTCFTLLRNIEKLMHDEFLRWIPNPPGPKSNNHMNLPMLTHFIFEQDKRYKSGKQTMLKMAAQVVETYFSKEGNDGQTKILA